MSRNPKGPEISILIPTLNEGPHLRKTLAACRLEGERVEILVVDGGSSDDTVRIAREMGIEVIESAPGRGIQLNAGARAARSEALLFLHADTLLPPGFADTILEELARDGVVAGAFRFRTDLDRRSMRLIERVVNLRSRLLQMPYGDQALFVGKQTFFSLGGFSDIPLMEDFEFVRRARKSGRIVLASQHIVTSGRRWERSGVWKVTFWNQLFILGFTLGISPKRLYDSYRKEGFRR